MKDRPRLLSAVPFWHYPGGFKTNFASAGNFPLACNLYVYHASTDLNQASTINHNARLASGIGHRKVGLMIHLCFKAMCFSLTLALLHGCSDSSDSLTSDKAMEKSPAIVAAETAALEVLDLHLEARNNLDPEAIASANNYPNLRIREDHIQVYETHDIYRSVEELVVMPPMETSEWDHSEWDEIEIIQSSENKVHLAVDWSRINKDGDRYISSTQFYIVTNEEDHWGIQIRSPLVEVDLLTHESSRIDPDAEEAALDVLKNYIAARNNRDSESIAALNHYPFALLDGVKLQIFNTPEDYISYEENTVIHSLDYAEWDHSELDKFEVIQSAPSKVHLTYSCSHIDVIGECINIEEGLWVVTKAGDRWGILGRSMF